ncbi:hypothetical protein LXL04_013896 [Taraxacum kok-saghyz]
MKCSFLEEWLSFFTWRVDFLMISQPLSTEAKLTAQSQRKWILSVLTALYLTESVKSCLTFASDHLGSSGKILKKKKKDKDAKGKLSSNYDVEKISKPEREFLPPPPPPPPRRIHSEETEKVEPVVEPTVARVEEDDIFVVFAAASRGWKYCCSKIRILETIFVPNDLHSRSNRVFNHFLTCKAT